MRYNNITVGMTAVKLPLGEADVPVVINNGDSTIYMGNTADVSPANGFPLGSSIGYEFTRNLEESGWTEVWVISDAVDGDVRYGTVG